MILLVTRVSLAQWLAFLSLKQKVLGSNTIFYKHILQILQIIQNLIKNKKVLLRERKKHTVRRVASARGGGEGGVCGGYLPWSGRTYLRVPPILTWLEGTYLGVPPPHPDPAGGRGYISWMGRGYLPWGTNILTWPGGVPTYLGQGGTYLGVPPPS